ncbi:class I SAM-dependent methyltransferase [Marinobacter profundi]|uniref:2-polyprenyl-3-methyl-5-hydroxy-6-metoxy-1, 4-benzoquinol methylase n=1 Tax=Marinobacter profundi TaxID=2666256 RepID=A0A2G1UKQ0_9GAMM|nr:class I SAM-dependent methyltransferase [Marinobacter profundi]PHQ15048.1 2-polyprenyl-3-methyl-5-hydroxy-6-metoxy-1,4-benzoquinol methylase [Marinobacter profundi]
MNNTPESSFERCPVCQGSGSLRHLVTIREVPYWRCERCQCTLMDARCRLSPDDEQEVYRLHDNQPEDPGYRRFLNKLAGPLLARLAPGSEGLDFGCGPGPALAMMLREAGMQVRLFDPLFYPNHGALAGQYEFVTCTEVVEHLHHPLETFSLLDRLLKPGGLLGVMTCFQTDDSRFANWHYRRDPTHVVFYREATLQWLADHFGWVLEIPAKDVAIFRKPLSQPPVPGNG